MAKESSIQKRKKRIKEIVGSHPPGTLAHAISLMTAKQQRHFIRTINALVAAGDLPPASGMAEPPQTHLSASGEDSKINRVG